MQAAKKHVIADMLNIRPGEGGPVLLLLIHSFFMGLSLIIYETASYSLFIAEFRIQYLPIVYIVSAFVITTTGYIYSKFEEHLEFTQLLRLTVIFLLLSIIVSYVTLFFFDIRWVRLALVIWHAVFAAIIGLEFWGLVGHLLDVRQGKRLFGLIGAGELAAVIVGGLTVTFLVDLLNVNVREMFPISAAAMLGCLLSLEYISKKYQSKLTFEPEDENNHGESASGLSRNRYMVLVVCFMTISVFGYYFIDYVFLDRVDFRFQQNENVIGSFLGKFFAVIGIVNLISNVFVPGRVISRYGLNIGLFTVSTLVGIGLVVAAVAKIGLGSMEYFFWIIVVCKLVDDVCRTSIEEPSIRILYQPFPPGQRMKAQTLLETMVEPIAGAVAGGLLLIMGSYLSLDTMSIVWMMLGFYAIQLVVAYFLRKEYTVALTHILEKRKIDKEFFSFRDASSVSVLEKRLKSNHPGEVIYCLNILEEIEHDAFESFLLKLIEHVSPEVRKHVLRKIAERNITATLAVLEHKLDRIEAYEKRKRREERADEHIVHESHHPINPSPPTAGIDEEPGVAGELLRTYCAIAETEAIDRMLLFLDSREKEYQKGAMVGLLKHAGIDGMLAAGSKLNELLMSPEPWEREFSAHILGEVGISTFYRPLINLLRDTSPKVRRAALIASGKLQNQKLVEPVLQNLYFPEDRNIAVNTLSLYGESILPELEAWFHKEDAPHQVRIRIARIIGKIGGAEAIEILKKKIDHSDEEIRNQVLASLISCGYQTTTKEFSIIHERIRNEVADATWALSAILDMGDYENSEMLNKALNSEFERNKDRIFLLLAMIYPANSILRAQKNLTAPSSEKRAYALEYLDNELTQDLKQIIFPLIENLTISQRFSKLVTHFHQDRMGRHKRLKQILSRNQQWTTSWTKICALFTAGQIGTMDFYGEIVSNLTDHDPVVRETAIYALGSLNPDDLIERLEKLKNDKHLRVAAYARHIVNAVGFTSVPVGKGYLTRSGRYTVTLFKNILMDDQERVIRRCRAAAILSRFPDQEAGTALLDALIIADKMVRYAVLEALVNGKFTIEEKKRKQLITLLYIEVEDAKRVLLSIMIFMAQKHSERLVNALNQEIDWNRKRMLAILALLSAERKPLNAIDYWYIRREGRDVPHKITVKLGYLTLQIPDQEMRKKVFALLRCKDPRQLKTIWELKATYTTEAVKEHLERIAFGSSVYTLSWSKICALEMIVNLHLDEYVPQIVEKLKGINDFERATAAWALFKMDPKVYESYAGKLRNDLSYLVSKTARQIEMEQSQSQKQLQRV